MRTRTPIGISVLFALAVLLVAAQPASAVKVCTYNALNWPGDYAERVDAFVTVMDSIDADLVVLQEVTNWSSANIFRDYVLNATVPGEYVRMPFIDGPDTDNACFFKPDVLDSLDYGYLDTGVRYTAWYKFRPVGYSSTQAEFIILSTHLKAGSSSSDQTERLEQTTVIRNWLNDFPAGSNFMVAGDFNLQSSSEGSYQMLIGYQVDNDGRSKDPINTGGTWHDNYALRLTHTQSPRVDGGSGSGGGMDDRFDFVLVSYALDDGEGLSYVPGSYVPFGNDGLRLNNDINDPPNILVGDAMADALYTASDHLPVFLDLQLPARLNSFGETIYLTDSILNSSSEETLHVSNDAPPPADSLNYSFAPPADFTAPSGNFSLGAEQGTDHIISMDTSSTGLKSGTLEILSNDIDNPIWPIQLEGSVLDHASPSLADSAVLTAGTLDFGSVAPGGSAAGTLYVHNYGYDDFQALLDVHDIALVGGDGRFSFTGGFVPKTAGETPAEYELTFDAAGAAQDSLYTAALTLATRDDPAVLGGTDLSDLDVTLQVYVTDETGIEDDPVTALALGPGAPNPFTRSTSLSFSTPVPGHAVIEVYDVSGRLVATLQDGPVSAGSHPVTWDGRDASGSPAASGIYFCRARVGDWTESRKVVLLR